MNNNNVFHKFKTFGFMILIMTFISACAHTPYATHEGNFAFYNPYKGPVRIYSGSEEELQLTINIWGASAMELLYVLVNGAAIPDGNIQKKVGNMSRTFRLKNVNTIDLVLKNPPADKFWGYYIISPVN